MHFRIANKILFYFYSGGSSRLDEALECYARAANLFKMAKNWSQAGKSFCEAANLHAKAGSRHDAATNYVDASNCYKKTDTNEAVKCLLKAIEIYTDMGRFNMAAKHHQSIAEMYENEANDLVSETKLVRRRQGLTAHLVANDGQQESLHTKMQTTVCQRERNTPRCSPFLFYFCVTKNETDLLIFIAHCLVC